MTEAIDIAPSFVVDVTPSGRRSCAPSPPSPASSRRQPGRERRRCRLDRFKEAVELAGRRHGQRIGVRYGEGFVTREPLAVDDLLSLAGSSI